MNVEKELRHERERCAILERSRNRKVAELFTKEQQRMGKQVSPLLTLDVVNGTHKRIPLKTMRNCNRSQEGETKGQ